MVRSARGQWAPVTRVWPFWHGSASIARPQRHPALRVERSEISITLGTFPNGPTHVKVRVSRWERFHRQRSRPAAGLARTPPPAGPPLDGRGGDTYHHSRGHGSRAMSTSPDERPVAVRYHRWGRGRPPRPHVSSFRETCGSAPRHPTTVRPPRVTTQSSVQYSLSSKRPPPTVGPGAVESVPTTCGQRVDNRTTVRDIPPRIRANTRPHTSPGRRVPATGTFACLGDPAGRREWRQAGTVSA